MPGMTPPQAMPTMPAAPSPPNLYPLPVPQPFAFNPAAAGATPTTTPPQPAPNAPQEETGKPVFDLGFDPSAKAALPFDLPGQGEAQGEQAAAAPLPSPLWPAPSFPAPSIPAGVLPPATLLAPSAPAANFGAGSGGEDFLPPLPAAAQEETAPGEPPKVLHIRCPSGHLVKAGSDLLGKNGRCPACKKTFELRYEDSVEFQRRKEKILRREEIKTAKTWVAWAFLAAFLLFAGLVALMLVLSSMSS